MEAIVGGQNSLVGKELKVTLSVQDWNNNKTGSGSQSAIVYSKDVEISFLEGAATTFKPGLPFSLHVSLTSTLYLYRVSCIKLNLIP